MCVRVCVFVCVCVRVCVCVCVCDVCICVCVCEGGGGPCALCIASDPAVTYRHGGDVVSQEKLSKPDPLQPWIFNFNKKPCSV